MPRRSHIDLAAPPKPFDLEEPWPDGFSPRPPLRLAGELPPRPRVAIVGTRRADREALGFAEDLGSMLGRAGIPVVSGGARGIDAAAHEGALAGRGVTVAVLATGLVRAYPPEHGDLFSRVARSGALCTEGNDDNTVTRGHFVSRNTLLAALSDVVVVVQAPARSGALSTARAGRSFGLPVLAVPAAPWDLRSEGNAALLEKGRARPCFGAADVFDAIGADLPSPETPERADRVAIDGPHARLLAALSNRPRHVDELVADTGLEVTTTQRALLDLVLRGVARSCEGGRYAKT